MSASDARITPSPGTPGEYLLSGGLDFVSVPFLLKQGYDWLSGPQVRVDLSGVTRCSSAAIGLLLEWLRQAAARDCRLVFLNMPPALLEIARVSDIDGLLTSPV